MTSQLTLSTFAAPARPLNIPLDVAAPEGGWTWPPTSVTLIAGDREAILVDTLPALEDAVKLADWIEASGSRLELEGHEVIAVAAGRSDISHSSYLYVPDLKAVIVGDIAYNDVHPTLVDSDHHTRQDWIDTLVGVQALKPEIVVAAHRREDAANDAQVLADTISYIEEADRLLAEGPRAAQFIEHMLAECFRLTRRHSWSTSWSRTPACRRLRPPIPSRSSRHHPSRR